MGAQSSAFCSSFPLLILAARAAVFERNRTGAEETQGQAAELSAPVLQPGFGSNTHGIIYFSFFSPKKSR